MTARGRCFGDLQPTLVPQHPPQEAHIARLRVSLKCSGDASLQNALDVAVDGLAGVPPYGQREVLFLFAGLSSCDPGKAWALGCRICSAKALWMSGRAPEVCLCKECATVASNLCLLPHLGSGDISASIARAKSLQAQISVVALSAEVFVCKQMTQVRVPGVERGARSASRVA